MTKDITLEYSNEYYANTSCISTYNEIIQNFKPDNDKPKQTQNKKCPRCKSIKTISKQGANICLICGDYF